MNREVTWTPEMIIGRMIQRRMDDVTVDENGAKWSQMCDECVDHFRLKRELLDNAGQGICGVTGCENEAEYYIDFLKTLDGIKVEEHRGRWSSFDSKTYILDHGQEPELLFLMEHDTYGDGAAFIVVDENGKLVANDCHNGWFDFEYMIETDYPREEWTK